MIDLHLFPQSQAGRLPRLLPARICEKAKTLQNTPILVAQIQQKKPCLGYTVIAARLGEPGSISGAFDMTMDSAQIRHKNFQKLFHDFIDQHPNLPQRGMLKLFAERLGLSDRYLSHIKCRRKNIGSNIARTIEERLRLPHGWMDREHDALNLPIDEKEKLFVETALSLFRAQPREARELMIDLLRRRLQAGGKRAAYRPRSVA
jgi:hypothetical protein